MSEPLTIEVVLNILTEVFKCEICLETCKDPVALSCQHLFCRGCMNDYLNIDNAEKMDNDFSCPKCKESTSSSYLLCSLNEIPFINDLWNLFNNITKRSVCQHHECPKSTNAVVFCKNCEKSLCASCFKAHNENAFCKSHQISNIEESASGLIKSFVRYCPIHEDEKTRYYCFKEKQSICVACLHGEHKDHETRDIVYQAKENKEVISSIAKNLMKYQNNLNENMHSMKNVKEIIKSQVQGVRTHIKTVLDNFETKLLDKIEHQQLVCTQRMFQLQRTQQLSEAIQNCGPNYSIVDFRDTLEKHDEKFAKTCKSEIATLISAPINDVELEDWVGKLVVKGENMQLKNMEYIRSYTLPNNVVIECLKFDPKSSDVWLTTGTSSLFVYDHNFVQKTEFKYDVATLDKARMLCFLPKFNKLVVTHSKASFAIICSKTGEYIKSVVLPAVGRGIDVSFTNNLVVVALENGNAVVFDNELKNILTTIPNIGTFAHVAFSDNDDRFILSDNNNLVLRVFEKKMELKENESIMSYSKVFQSSQFAYRPTQLVFCKEGNQVLLVDTTAKIYSVQPDPADPKKWLRKDLYTFNFTPKAFDVRNCILLITANNMVNKYTFMPEIIQPEPLK